MFKYDIRERNIDLEKKTNKKNYKINSILWCGAH